MVAFKLWLLSFVLVVGGLVGIQGTKYYGNLEGRHATLCTGGTLTLECAPSNGVPRVITILSDWNLTRSNCPERCCPSTTDPNVNVYRTKEGVEIQREAVLEVNNILSNCRYVDKCRYSLTEDDDLWFEKQQGDSDKMLYLSFYYVCVPAISKGQECYIDDLKRAYTGRLDQSREGTTCERWSTVIDVVSNYITPLWFPDTLTDNGYDLNKVENFCRNPGQLKDLYCFVNVALPGANPDYQIIWCDLPNRCKVKYVDEQQLVGPQSDNEEGGSSSQKLLGLPVTYWIIIGVTLGIFVIVIAGVVIWFSCRTRPTPNEEPVAQAEPGSFTNLEVATLGELSVVPEVPEEYADDQYLSENMKNEQSSSTLNKSLNASQNLAVP